MPKRSLNTQLEPIRKEAGLDAILVTDSAGAVVASVYPRTPEGRFAGESLDSLWALAQRVVGAGELEALKRIQEVIYYTYDGQQVICRPFTVEKSDYLLVLLAPPHRAYKQAANRLVKALRKALV